jgi:hypothetical protein
MVELRKAMHMQLKDLWNPARLPPPWAKALELIPGMHENISFTLDLPLPGKECQVQLKGP